jgi:transposase
VDKIIRIGMDTSKSIFQLHGVNEAEQPVLRKKLRRRDVLEFFSRLEPTVVAIEACGGSHYWARELSRSGHEVRLIAPQLAKPYVKRGKNDAADAEALCEAVSRPTMRFVPVKSAENQAALMLAGVRDQLVRSRTRLGNAIRGYAAEFGLIAAKGPARIEPLLKSIQEDKSVPALALELFALQGKEYAALTARIEEVDAKLLAWHRSNEMSRRLAAIPSIGPVTASMLVMKAPDPKAFRSGRDFAAWLGLTPKDHSTAGKTRLGGITRAGDEALRSLLIVGATSVIQKVRRGSSAQNAQAQNAQAWLVNLLKRKEPKHAAVALANKTARIAWKLMATGEAYKPGYARPTEPLAA